MRLLISLSALLISTLFVQMGIGSLRPFDAISGQALGFSPVEIGLLASGHFAGFLLGCIFSPHLVRRAGHSRAFAVLAGTAVISIIAHPIFPDAMFWTFIRVLSGFSVAGCYTLIESWLQAKIPNEHRGRLFSVYRIVDMSGQIMANAIIATLTPASYISYNIIGIVMCFAILPLALTQSKEPELPETARYEPLFAYRVSPLASLGVIVAGLSTATFGSVGPIAARSIGEDRVGCVAPALGVGKVTVGLSLDANARETEWSHLVVVRVDSYYLEGFLARGAEGAGMPSGGAASGGATYESVADVAGIRSSANADRTSVSSVVRCAFGDARVAGTWIHRGGNGAGIGGGGVASVLCVPPPRLTSAGFVPVRIFVDGSDANALGDSAIFQYAVAPDARVRTIFPRTSWGAEVVSVAGAHLAGPGDAIGGAPR